MTRDEDFAFDDGWGGAEEARPTRTTVERDTSRTILARNTSPDVPFDRSINPYRGCEHGCFYCFARPTHAFLGLSPGLIFRLGCSPNPTPAHCLPQPIHSGCARTGIVIESKKLEWFNG